MITFDPHDLASKLIDHGNDWSDKNAAADALEETRKTLRSQIALKFIGEVGAVNKAEMMAEATIEYIDHVKGMVEARRLANRAKVLYDTDKAFIDMMRSQESTKREEMRIR